VIQNPEDGKETAMKKDLTVTAAGVDVHYHFSRVAFVNAQGEVVRRERLDHRDRPALGRKLQQWPQGLTTVLEASFGWGWLSDVMEQAGLEVRLSNCWKVEQMRKARNWVKTNDKDANLLALLPGEQDKWWQVWRAPPEVRQQRESMRHRADLVAVQTQIKCRIHAIFHRHGIFHDFSDLFGGGGRRFLEQLAGGLDPQSQHLSPAALEALQSNLVVLSVLRQELAAIAIALRGRLEKTPMLLRIQSVPGFGLILAHVLAAELGQLSRFRSAGALAAYSLLAPRADDTGEPQPNRAPLGRHLGTRGNRTLKWAFIEAAHGAVRHGGCWRELFDRQTDSGRKDRQRGYIAVARKLVDVVYAVLRDERLYQEPRAAASRPSATRSRPGTGRPCHPMVAAMA
jgi:transposase